MIVCRTGDGVQCWYGYYRNPTMPQVTAESLEAERAELYRRLHEVDAMVRALSQGDFPPYRELPNRIAHPLIALRSGLAQERAVIRRELETWRAIKRRFTQEQADG